jgi:hypothetical protein
MAHTRVCTPSFFSPAQSAIGSLCARSGSLDFLLTPPPSSPDRNGRVRTNTFGKRVSIRNLRSWAAGSHGATCGNTCPPGHVVHCWCPTSMRCASLSPHPSSEFQLLSGQPALAAADLRAPTRASRANIAQVLLPRLDDD